jgi:hypothetical protein
MTKLFSIASAMLIANIQVVSSAQLNMAIVYSEHEGFFASNAAIAQTLSGLFLSQATPILIPGNLALRQGLYYAERERLRDPLNRLFLIYNDFKPKITQTRVSAYTKREQLCNGMINTKNEIVEAYFTKISTFEKTTQQITVGQAAALFDDLLYFGTACEKNCIYSEHPRCKEGFDVTLYFNKYIKDIALDDWHLYAVKNSPQHFILYIPKKYATLHTVDLSNDENLKKLGFNSKALEKTSPETMAQKAAGYEFVPKTIASSINAIFAVPSAESIAAHVTKRATAESPDVSESGPWNIFVFGHGLPTKTDLSPLNPMLKSTKTKPVETVAYMAGMPAYEFLKLMIFWTTIPTNSVIYQTCFGGGLNANAIASTYTLIKQLAQSAGAHHHFPIVVSIASSEKITYATKAVYETFFENMARAFLSEKTIGEQKTLLQKAVRAISTDTPIILFPRQIIAFAGKTPEERVAEFRGALKKEKEQDKGVFTSLIEPEYTLTQDSTKNIIAGGTLVTPKTVTVSPEAIIFTTDTPDKPIDITVRVDRVTKTLIFEDSNPIFTIKPGIKHVTFTDIALEETWEKFLNTAFEGNGQPLHVTIESCTATTATKYQYEILVDVDLFTFPTSQTYYKGQGIFTRNGKWHIFTFPYVSSAKTIDIPSDPVIKKRTRRNIISQFEANIRLASAITGKNVDNILRWFGTPTADQNVLDLNLVQHAFNYLENMYFQTDESKKEILTDADLSKKIAVLTPTQKNNALVTMLARNGKPGLIQMTIAKKLLQEGAKPDSSIAIDNLYLVLQGLRGEDIMKIYANLTYEQKTALWPLIEKSPTPFAMKIKSVMEKK